MSMWKDWFNGLLGRETSAELKEIGHDAEGELSEDALKHWMKWAVLAIGICVITVSVLAAVSSVKNKKEAAILEVDSGTVLEFYLNRKGTILKAKGDAEEVLNDYSLEEGIEKILQGFLDHGRLGDEGAVIMTVRPAEEGTSADLERFADEIHVYAESFLRQKHSNGTVYVAVLEEAESFDETIEKYGVSLGKAALVQNLIHENGALRSGDQDRLLQMSVDEISAEISERKHETSFIVVVAKQVYAMMIETKAAEEETTAEMQETEVPEETTKETVKATTAAAAESMESPAETVETEGESAETEAEDGTAESGEDVMGEAEAEAESSEGSDESETEASVESETEAPETSAESQPETEAPETSAETQPGTQAPETSAETQPETQAPETSGAIQPETLAPETSAAIQPETQAPTEAPTAAPTETPTEPETTAPQNSQQSGSIIEQVIPLTPAG